MKPEPANEQALLKRYVELTGCSETEARGVFMHTCLHDRTASNEDATSSETPQNDALTPPPLPPA
jgi:hypothetical protein